MLLFKANVREEVNIFKVIYKNIFFTNACVTVINVENYFSFQNDRHIFLRGSKNSLKKCQITYFVSLTDKYLKIRTLHATKVLY